MYSPHELQKLRLSVMLALGFKDRARDLTFDMYGDWTLTDVEISPANPLFFWFYERIDIPIHTCAYWYLNMIE